MKQLLDSVKTLQNNETKRVIDAKMKEFEELGKKPSPEIFKELSFCLMTANFNAERSIAIQENIGDGFMSLPILDLAKKLQEFGHRFPNARAKYIAEARKYKDTIKIIINSFSSEMQARDWLAKNIKGLGYKESSHFLRNIGFKNLAIIDFHIIDLLVRHGLIERPKSLTKNKYLEIEKILKEIGERLDLNLAELDLYLWYLETGKILK